MNNKLIFILFLFNSILFAFSSCCADTIVPFFIDKPTTWIKTKQNIEIEYSSFNSKNEFYGIFESENKDYILLLLYFRYSRRRDNSPENFNKNQYFIRSDTIIPFTKRHERFFIVGKGANQLWWVVPTVIFRNDTIKMKTFGKRKPQHDRNAVFCPAFPDIMGFAPQDFQTMFDGKSLVFKTRLCDTLRIILK